VIQRRLLLLSAENGEQMTMRAYLVVSCAVLMLFAAIAPRPVLADDKCPPENLQLDKVVTPEVRLGTQLTLKLSGLAGTACDLSGLRLRLGGYTFSNKPELDDRQDQAISFPIERLDIDRAGWTQILGAPPLGGSKQVEVALELPNNSVLPHAGAEMPKVQFVIFSRPQLIIGLFAAAVLLIVAFVGGSHTSLLRDPDSTIAKATDRTFSLGRCQMAFWFVLMTVGFVAIWLISGDYNGILTTQSLVLLGISGATALGAVSIDASKSAAGAAPANPLRHTTFWDDLLTDANGPVLQRLQVLIWTLVLGVISVFSIYRNLALPTFDDTLLAMAGISSGLYIGFKWPEKPA
jgi:hypothetical protein